MNERVFDGFCADPGAFLRSDAAYLAKKATQNCAKTRRSR
jgi:hypothetical protein